MVSISLKTEKSFIAHPWCLLSVVGLEEYSAHDWRAATSVQRAPVTWREWGLWSCRRHFTPAIFVAVAQRDARVLHVLQESCPLARRTETPEWLSRVCTLVSTWWCHIMGTFSALLALCAWNSPVTGEFPAQKASNAEFWCREAGDLRRHRAHYDVTVMIGHRKYIWWAQQIVQRTTTPLSP